MFSKINSFGFTAWKGFRVQADKLMSATRLPGFMVGFLSKRSRALCQGTHQNALILPQKCGDSSAMKKVTNLSRPGIPYGRKDSLI